MDVAHYNELAKKQKKEHVKFLKNLKDKPPKNLDDITEKLHDEVFAEMDCMTCANCCKTTSPIFTTRDVDSAAKFLKMKPSVFQKQYLEVDKDEDLVLKSSPCSFLNDDNSCGIYEARPKACQEYPHTNRKKFHQINYLTIENTQICPATYEFVERLKVKLQEGKKVVQKEWFKG
jgi:uncharacterized protein